VGSTESDRGGLDRMPPQASTYRRCALFTTSGLRRHCNGFRTSSWSASARPTVSGLSSGVCLVDKIENDALEHRVRAKRKGSKNRPNTEKQRGASASQYLGTRPAQPLSPQTGTAKLASGFAGKGNGEEGETTRRDQTMKIFQ
jgi:hypothetical protein